MVSNGNDQNATFVIKWDDGGGWHAEGGEEVGGVLGGMVEVG